MEKTKLYTVRMVPKMAVRNVKDRIPEKAALIAGGVYVADMYYDKRPMRYVAESKTSGLPVFECKYLGRYRSDLVSSVVTDSNGNTYKIVEMDETMPWEIDGLKSRLVNENGDVDVRVLQYRLKANAAPVSILTVVTWALLFAITGGFWVVLPLAVLGMAVAALIPEGTLKLKDK